MKQISNAEIASLAREEGFEFASIKAVAIVEGSGAGFDRETGLILLQFEPHLFKKVRINNGVERQPEEWKAFKQAYAIDSDAAIEATSWGMFQILGDKYAFCGYKSPAEMLSEFKMGEYFQLRALLRYLKTQPLLLNAIKKRDWATFARWYNGKDYKRYNYDGKLSEAFQVALKLKF